MGRDAQRLAHVLLDEQHGHPGRQDLRQHAVDPPHDDRREAERQLVEQQHPRVRDERPADGDGLLLAAGHLRGLLAAAFLHPGEQVVDLLDGPRTRTREGRADLQVLLERQRREQAAALGHHHDARGGPLLGPQAGHVLAVVDDRPLGGVVQPGDRAQQRRLAGAVRADDRVDLTGEHPQRDPGQGTQLAVVHDEVAHVQQRCALLRGGRLVRGCAHVPLPSGSTAPDAPDAPDAPASSSPASASNCSAVTSTPR